MGTHCKCMEMQFPFVYWSCIQKPCQMHLSPGLKCLLDSLTFCSQDHKIVNSSFIFTIKSNVLDRVFIILVNWVIETRNPLLSFFPGAERACSLLSFVVMVGVFVDVSILSKAFFPIPSVKRMVLSRHLNLVKCSYCLSWNEKVLTNYYSESKPTFHCLAKSHLIIVHNYLWMLLDSGYKSVWLWF